MFMAQFAVLFAQRVMASMVSRSSQTVQVYDLLDVSNNLILQSNPRSYIISPTLLRKDTAQFPTYAC
jgi:hypothetical protein